VRLLVCKLAKGLGRRTGSAGCDAVISIMVTRR